MLSLAINISIKLPPASSFVVGFTVDSSPPPSPLTHDPSHQAPLLRPPPPPSSPPPAPPSYSFDTDLMLCIAPPLLIIISIIIIILLFLLILLFLQNCKAISNHQIQPETH